MLKFVDFITDEAEDGLVTIHKRKAHCLGDWSGPYKPYLPEKFANTCLIVETFYNLIDVMKVLKKTEGISAINKIIDSMKDAIDRDFFDKETGNYCGNEQGSNAFALNIGLGDERTVKNLVERYAAYRGFDTGIFSTKILPKVLFERGFGDVAMDLYTSTNDASFKAWMDAGETTLRESWFNTRSHNHPMFGAPVILLFEHVLGIQQKKGSVAYEKVIIHPRKIDAMTDVSGSIVTPKGKFAVAYKKIDGRVHFTVTVPVGKDCEFCYEGKRVTLKDGENKFVI
jgi:alpha-L-rhamnosidase